MIPTLHDYQRYAAEFVKARKFSGLYLDMGLGKSIDDNTLIPTPNGEKRVGDIVVGDQLYDRKGQPTTVIATYPHKNKRAFEVKLKDGRSFIACDEHLVPYCKNNDENDIRNKPLGDMINDYKESKNEKTNYNYAIPQNKAVEYDKVEHKIDPYLLGILINKCDFMQSSLIIKTSDEKLMNKFAEITNIPKEKLTYRRDAYRYYITKEPKAKAIQKELKTLGLRFTLSSKTFIPEDYLIDSYQNRFKLLKGLMDTNGYINSEFENKKRYYIHSSLSKKLTKDIQNLSLSLGFGAEIHEEINKKQECIYNVHIFTDELFMEDPMNIGIGNVINHHGSEQHMTPIIDIKEVEPRDMTCFTVDNDEHLFLINDYIVTHNTLITLTALSELGKEGKINGHILVIAPKKIAINTWPAEVEKWDHTKNAPYTVLTGISKKKRDEALKKVYTDSPRLYFVNPELVPTLVKDFGDYWPFKNVIIDEVQTFKSYSSQRFKAIKKVRGQIDRVIALTGTPAPNSLMDLWPQITLLDGGRRLGANITQYRETYFNPGRRTPQGYPYEWWVKAGAEDQIYDRIKDIVISMKAVDHLKMPELTFNNVVVEMNKKERKVYDEMKKEKVLPLADGGEITSANAATLSAQLLQLATGAIYTDPETKNIAVLHDHKIEALEQIIDSSQGQPLLVFYWFKHDVKRLVAHFGDDVTVFDGSPEQLAKWNKGDIPVLLCHPASAGYGLNFQEGGHIAVWFTLPNFNLGLYLQSNARLYRQGQNKPVIIHHIVTKNTIDEKVIDDMDVKEQSQEELMNAVKAQNDHIQALRDELGL